jgi:alkylhydroperoxidase/carboxymuconolactone decarboxylase family protein YurZ
MTTSDAAKAHHDQLFGERNSTLAQTDPEFIAYFDNFAFDEILTDATNLDESVDRHTRLLVQLAAVLAACGLAEFRVLATAALTNAGVSPVELKELVYRAVAYVGLARVYDYLHAVNDILTASGVELPLTGQATSTPDTRLERGKQVQEHIVARPRRPDARRRSAGLQAFPALPDRQLLRRHRGPRRLGFAHPRAAHLCDARRPRRRRSPTTRTRHRQPQRRQPSRPPVGRADAAGAFIGYPRALNALAAVNDIAND